MILLAETSALDRTYSSLAVLLGLVALGGVAFALFQVGLIALVVRLGGATARGSVAAGFRVWERLCAHAPWPAFLAVVLGLLVVGRVAAPFAPAAAVGCALAALFMGVTACLAYMSIDVERYEVER